MRLRAGGAVLELTTLRGPCRQLETYDRPDLPPIGSQLIDDLARAGDPASPRWAFGGFYARVAVPGACKPGDLVELLDVPA
jgi:MOSC domain-containing protein YiiM